MNSRMNTIRKAPIIDLLQQVNLPKDVISLGQGIPFFSPPADVIKATQKSLSTPQGYQYTTDQGLFELRTIIGEKLRTEQQVIVHPENQVMVTAGANQAFMNAMLSISSPGDEIIFFTPTYFNYVMAAKLAGCKPVFAPTDSNYQPIVEKLSHLISKKTRAIVTISPNNPTGAVYSLDSLCAINQLCQNHHLYHISDEVYEYFVYEDAKHHSPLRCDNEIEHTISLFSLSKAFALSGYRIGYMVFPDHLLNDLLKVQDTIGICAPALSQIAALTAIPMGRMFVSTYLQSLKENRMLVKEKVNEITQARGVWTKGAYYFFISLDTNRSSLMIAKRLIEEYGVIVLPGEMFDVYHPSIRLSYGNLSKERLENGLDRLITGLNHIS